MKRKQLLKTLFVGSAVIVSLLASSFFCFIVAIEKGVPTIIEDGDIEKSLIAQCWSLGIGIAVVVFAGIAGSLYIEYEDDFEKLKVGPFSSFFLWLLGEVVIVPVIMLEELFAFLLLLVGTIGLIVLSIAWALQKLNVL